MKPTNIALSRKRRRQLYHGRYKQQRKAQPGKKERRSVKTKDENQFDKPLKEPRSTPTLHEKLMAVRYAHELLEEKAEAKRILREPFVAGRPKEERAAMKENKARAKKTLKGSIQKKCMKKFTFMHQSQICKWIKRAKQERWEEIPDIVRRKCTTSSNQWTQKIGLAPRGRKVGGEVPYILQKELDLLIGEMSLGTSSISDRREVVTSTCIAAWLWLEKNRFRVIPLFSCTSNYSIFDDVSQTIFCWKSNCQRRYHRYNCYNKSV